MTTQATLTFCGGCASPLIETYYAPTGDAVCRRCYYAEQTRAQDARALASLQAEAPPGFKVAGTRTETPASATRAGFILLGCCVASTIATAVLIDRIYLASGLLGLLGLGAFARALPLAREQGSSRAGIVIGVVLSVLVILGLLVITIL